MKPTLPAIQGLSTESWFISRGDYTHFYRLSHSELVDIEKFDESNAYVLERFYTSAGNPVKKILLKLNLLDHRILKDGGEGTDVLLISQDSCHLKNLKKDAILKLFKITYQERYEHVGPEITSSQDGESRLCLVDKLKVFKNTFSHLSQDKGTSSSLKSMITTSNQKLMIEVKDYELKTKDKAYYVRFKFL
ncbi:hypothetical protein Tco_1203419 [Tanacetum coccineum]